MKKSIMAILLIAGSLLFSGSAFALEPWQPDKAKPDKIVLVVVSHDSFMQCNDVLPGDLFSFNSVIIVDESYGESIVPIDGYFSTPYSYGNELNTSAAKHDVIFSGRCTFY